MGGAGPDTPRGGRSAPAATEHGCGPLALFMSRGMSLRAWDELGILDRELGLYRSLATRLGGVAIMSYARSDESALAPAAGFDVRWNRYGLPLRIYERALPIFHARSLRRAGVYKTNQVHGGLAALRAARLHRRPLLARCGYLWSEGAERERGRGSRLARAARRHERRLFQGADAVAVTTERLAGAVCERYGLPRSRVAVVPNYVDTARFHPCGEAAPEQGALGFLGRLSPEKNLAGVIEAVSGLDGVSLTVIGDGPLRAELEQLAEQRAADVRFLGRVPNERLPALLTRLEAFVMPSFYEAHPKALLEAMACGLPVIGTDVDGIRELVRDGESGVLAGTSAVELRDAIESLLGDPGLRARLGQGARDAAGAFSLERVVEREVEALEMARRARARR